MSTSTRIRVPTRCSQADQPALGLHGQPRALSLRTATRLRASLSWFLGLLRSVMFLRRAGTRPASLSEGRSRATRKPSSLVAGLKGSRRTAGWCPSVNSFQLQPCDHTRVTPKPGNMPETLDLTAGTCNVADTRPVAVFSTLRRTVASTLVNGDGDAFKAWPEGVYSTHAMWRRGEAPLIPSARATHPHISPA